MDNKTRICKKCGKKENFYSKGLCRSCYMKRYYQLNPEKGRQYRQHRKKKYKIWCEQNKEKIRLYKRKYNKRWYTQNADKIKAKESPASKALKRDDCICQICGASEKLIVHHKDGKGTNYPFRKRNNALDNLITLCIGCHHRLHRGILII